MKNEERIAKAKAKLDELTTRHALSVARLSNPTYQALAAAARTLSKCLEAGLIDGSEAEGVLAALQAKARESAMRGT